ncbi:MAG TPA: TIGR03960 family B12-binding radical SAM protein [Chloroflexi bacterium]|nr:TIGR03960 family B12-binding radical SAM protein [Chloroflexota bacterium]
MQLSEERLQELLGNVQKPLRYVGHEWNSITKEWANATVRMVLAYPDVYEIGMSNLGLSILYDLVNRHDDWLAERTYAPRIDMEAAMRAAGVPLYALESRRAVAHFDVVGFSLQYELNYTNVPNMLDLAGLAPLAADRPAALPLVIAGGSGTYNPEPLADFFDAMVIGEAEDALPELLTAVEAFKAESGAGGAKEDLLRRLATIDGVYVPSFYAPQEDGRVAPLQEGAPARVRRRIARRLGPVPTRPIVPTMQVVHDRAVVEIQRGCSRGCRFCQAGMIYRPVRERPVEEVLDAVDTVLAKTGHTEVGLLSLSSSDHSGIAAIIQGVLDRHQGRRVAVSLPSLRIDSFSVQLATMIQSTRKTGFTFAPEAGSQRLRDVINKGVTEDDLLNTAEAAFSAGWNRIKLYFMIGLPTETDDDILEMARLIRTLAALGRKVRGRTVDIAVSASTFVPKPHTPFQWAPLADRATVERRQALLREHARGRGIHLSWSDWDSTWLEALLSRGDRRLGRVLLRAWRLGAAFDAWSERFRPDLWRRALEEEGIDDRAYIARERCLDEPLPWEVIDVGVRRAYLVREWQRAACGEVTGDCRRECRGCGITAAYADDGADTTWRCP